MDWEKIITSLYQPLYTASDRFFFFCQINALLFTRHTPNDKEIRKLLFKLYMNILDEFSKAIHFDFNIERSESSNLVFILTNQFLSHKHAPTAVTLSIAEYLKSIGKDILIVNTAEFLGGLTPELANKDFPFYDINLPNYNSEYCNVSQLEYNNNIYPFFQFENNMPDVDSINIFLNEVKEQKPEFIVNIGGSSPLADFCSNIVPTLCYSLSNSICYSTAHAQYIGRDLLTSDTDFLSILGRSPHSVIPGKYIYNIEISGKKELRADLGISENTFLLAIVGNRLELELDNRLLSLLDEIVSAKIEIVFIGYFNNYEAKLANYNNIKEHSHIYGYAEDLSAVLSICNLYVNPIRIGGGTSAVISLRVGCPVLTTDYGDVANAVGNDFIVNNIDNYASNIKHYITDKTFYSLMQAKAVERASILTDTKRMYDSLFSTFISSIYD